MVRTADWSPDPRVSSLLQITFAVALVAWLLTLALELGWLIVAAPFTFWMAIIPAMTSGAGPLFALGLLATWIAGNAYGDAPRGGFLFLLSVAWPLTTFLLPQRFVPDGVLLYVATLAFTLLVTASISAAAATSPGTWSKWGGAIVLSLSGAMAILGLAWITVAPGAFEGLQSSVRAGAISELRQPNDVMRKLDVRSESAASKYDEGGFRTLERRCQPGDVACSVYAEDGTPPGIKRQLSLHERPWDMRERDGLRTHVIEVDQMQVVIAHETAETSGVAVTALDQDRVPPDAARFRLP